ncbi:MAG: hypothetical protein U0520_02580 [Candidatus Saccharimonadales bacterium]|jgi:transcriptional regulator with XRE-family HTH domain
MKKADAIALRDAGYSYSIISKRLNIAKSTLSSWFRDRPFTPNEETLASARSGRLSYGLLKKQQREDETKRLIEKGREEVGTILKRDLWMAGLGLWLGEGAKTNEQLRLANSDPRIIQLWMRWLREVCDLNDQNITVRMHLYSDSDQSECQDFWSSVTGLGERSFRKTQIDTRLQKVKGKKGNLPYGTLHVSVVGNGNPDFGVRLFRKMNGWLSAILA